MDSLTHLVLGAAIGEAVAGKKIGRKAMLFGAIANTIPDLDVLGGPFFSDAHQMMVHRGITHSFLFAFLFSPLLGYVLSRFIKKIDLDIWGWTSLIFTGLLSHDLLDSLTGYGTGWFEPFSHYRVSFNTIFVADPFYTLPFLIFMLVAVFSVRNLQRRKRATYAGLLISGLYLVFTFFNHYRVDQLARQSLGKKRIAYEDLIVTPTPLNNFLWMAYTRDVSGTWVGYYSLFDKRKEMDFKRMWRNDSLLNPYKDSEDLKALKLLSNGNYIVTREGSDIYFNDLRFGQMSGWDLSDTNFVFKFKMGGHSSNPRALNRMKFKGSYGRALSSMIERIKGN
jgi:inner membrane protein